MAPPEQLTLELAAAIQRKPLPSRFFLKAPDGLAALFSGQGSQNIPLLIAAIKLLCGINGARDQWLKIFEYFRKAWMGSELCSFIYGMWHKIAVLAVAEWATAHRDSELLTMANEWLLYYGCLAELCRAPDGQIIWAGLRSGGHEPHAGWREWAHDLGMGRDRRAWEAAGKEAGLGMKNSWMWGSLWALADVLAAAYEPLRDDLSSAHPGAPPSFMPHFGLITSLRIIRTEGGVACMIGSNPNPNTTAWGALVWNGGLECLPHAGGRRVREQAEELSCALNGRVINYRSSLYGEDALPLPTGDFTMDLMLPGADAFVTLPAPDPPAVPTGAPLFGPQLVPLDLLANDVAALRVGKVDAPTQAAIVNRLRSGGVPIDCGAMADQVERFGIGEGQAQAPAWHRVIADLRARAVVS